MARELTRLLGCLPLVAVLIVGPAWAQGATPQLLTWTGAKNEILTLNVAHPLGATASSGLLVTLRVESGPAVLGEGTIIVTGVGTVWVSAEQTGDAAYLPARETQSFNVRQTLLTPVGGYDTSGVAYSVQVVGTYAYVADASAGLQVIDVSNPASPVRVGGVDTSGHALDAQVVGNFAYVAASEAGLQVIDVSNPAKPVRVGEWYDTNGGGHARGVAVVRNYAYVAGYPGVQVIDVSNPANPVRVGGYDTSGEALSVQVVGDFAYVAASEAGLQVIDVNNPANPVRVGGIDTGNARAVHVVGNHAYLADGTAGLQVLDVSNPANPLRVGEFGRYAYSVQVVGNYAYAADESAGLQVIDVSNPAKPVRVGRSQTSFAFGVQVIGNYAYVADYYAGLQILELRLGYPQTLTWTGTPNEILTLNVAYPLAATASTGFPVTLRVESGPAVVGEGTITATGVGNLWVTAEQAGDGTYLPAPGIVRGFNVRHVALTRVGGYDTSGLALGVQVVGNHAYVADHRAGLQVLDVSNPANPVRVGGFDTSGEARGVQVVGNHAYVADDHAGLQVLDVSNPASPVRVGGYNTSGYAYRVQAVGNHAYVADYIAGLQVLDVSNPANPVRVGGVGTGYALDVLVLGNYAYVADSSAGLQVVNVSDPSNPLRVGGHTSSAHGVQVVGNHAYVANYYAGLQMIDVSNPAKPVRVGEVATGYAHGVQVVGNYAYVADDAGLQVLDVSNPSRPLRVGGYHIIGGARSAQVVGNYAYVTAAEAGLLILQLRLGFRQTLEFQFPAVAIELVPTGVRLRFAGVPGRDYYIERAGAVTGPWSTINTQTTPPSGLLEYVDTLPHAGSGFYRIVQP